MNIKKNNDNEKKFTQGTNSDDLFLTYSSIIGDLYLDLQSKYDHKSYVFISFIGLLLYKVVTFEDNIDLMFWGVKSLYILFVISSFVIILLLLLSHFSLSSPNYNFLQKSFKESGNLFYFRDFAKIDLTFIEKKLLLDESQIDYEIKKQYLEQLQIHSKIIVYKATMHKFSQKIFVFYFITYLSVPLMNAFLSLL